MTRRIIVLAALAAASFAAIDSVATRPARSTTLPAEPAGVFAAHVLRLEVAGRWAQQYALLNPGHRQLITERQYVACSRPLGTAIGQTQFAVKSMRIVPLHVPYVAAHTAALVTIEMRRPDRNLTTTLHVHAVPADGRWTWILGPAFLRALDARRCLYGAPLVPAPAV